MRNEGYTIREIKKVVREKYGLEITQKDVRSVAIRITTGNYIYSNQDKGKILYLYKNYINTYKLIEYLNYKYNYNLSYQKLVDLACRNGVQKETQNMYSVAKVSRSDEYDIGKLYNSGYTSTQLAKIYGYKTRNSILQKLHKFNIEARDCNEFNTKNKSYFGFSLEKIDSEEKAYFLGLLLTDGYISCERGSVGIDLTDEDVIKFLSNYIHVRYTKIPPRGKAKLTKYRIVLYGREYIKQLERLGVVYNKTYSTKGPLIEKDETEYISYILRGIIDGDGWIRKDGREFFICSASQDFIKWCEKIMLEIGFQNIKISHFKNEFNGIYLIRTSSIYNLEILRQKIYNKPFGMMRKYDRLYKKDVQRL